MEQNNTFESSMKYPRLSTTPIPENPNKKLYTILLIIGPICLILIIIALVAIFSNKENKNTYDSCEFAFRTYEHGQTWLTEDGCQECRCNNGDVICSTESLCDDEFDVDITIITSETIVPTISLTPVIAMTNTPVIPSTGTIKGTLSGPPTDNPQNHIMKVCAENQNSGQLFCTNNINITPTNYNPTYSLQVPAGQYTVYSYETNNANRKIYYDQMVTCGFHETCPSDIIIITIQGGQTLTNIDPTDWYTEH